jgi:hypothetical protein
VDDYVLRFGNQTETYRTDYGSLKDVQRIFDKKKKDSGCTWAEILYEPLFKKDKTGEITEDKETQVIIDSFSKKVIELFGKECVINIE